MKRYLIQSLAVIAVTCAAYSARAQGQAPEPAPAVSAPRLVRSVEPRYPESERSGARTARVRLVLSLDEAGRVSEAAVADSAGPDFDAAALEAARELEFEPARRDGKAVAAKIPFEFSFALAEPEPASVPEPEVPAAPAAPARAAAPAGDDGIDIDVEGERPPRETTRRVLLGEEITKIPGTNGDALRAIGNMPGVARPPGLAGLVIVRGSAPRDTQTFVDGTAIPIAYHFGGLSSVIPSEMLERIDFYPGNFGPQYGGSMGGVIDIGIRSPRKDRLGGLIQFDLLDGRVLAEGPLGDSTRVLLAGRRSWIDAWLGGALREAGMGVSVAPVYYDYQAMIEQDAGRHTTLRLLAFGSDDRLELTNPAPSSSDPAEGGAFGLHTRFVRVQARADTRVADDVRWMTTVGYGRDGEQFNMGALEVDATTIPLTLRSDVRVKLTPAVSLVSGIDAIYGSYDVRWRFPPLDIAEGQDTGPLFGRPMNTLRGSGHYFRPGGYALAELAPLRGLKLLPGVRVDYSRDTGRWTTDPRFGVRYDLRADYPRTTLKGGAGVYHQPPEFYESIPPFGNGGLHSSRALHYSAGIEQEFSRQVELSVEGFYKDLDDLVVATDAAGESANGVAYRNLGTGRTFGSEFLLRYKPDQRLFGWIAYTLSRSERRDAPGEDYHRFQYDQTHILTALGSVKVGKGWQLGARFRYVTGSPYTPYVGGVMDYDAGAYAPVSGPRYSDRLAAFHQVDLRVDKTWKFQAWQLTAYLDLQNAYNRKNSEAVSHNYDYSQQKPVSGLPLLPIIGLRGEL